MIVSQERDTSRGSPRSFAAQRTLAMHDNAVASSTPGCPQARAMVTPQVKPIPADAKSNNCPGRMRPSRRRCT